MQHPVHTHATVNENLPSFLLMSSVAPYLFFRHVLLKPVPPTVRGLQLRAMDTRIEVQLWNILKYVMLTLLLAPVVENAMSHITAWRNARLVNKHRGPIRLKASALGNFALHQEVETLHASSRLWQLFFVLFALAIALPFEYSSGARTRLTWSQRRSPSGSIPLAASDDLVLLALNDPKSVECVNPNRVANAGQFVSMQPLEKKPPFLEGNVTSEKILQLLDNPIYTWESVTLRSRNGDSGLVLSAGGPDGQLALIIDTMRSGILVADFGSGSLCKGLLDEVFLCYDMAGQFTLSQLTYSLAAVSGSSMFLRNHFENAAQLYQFKKSMVTNSIGDPSVKENLVEQGLNESGLQWLLRHQRVGEGRTFVIVTVRLNAQLKSVSCQSPGSVQIRPLTLRVGDPQSVESEVVRVSAQSELKLVKAGSNLQTMLLTRVEDKDWDCAVDEIAGVCVDAANEAFYFLTKFNEGHIHEYRTEFELDVTRSVESHADLAVLQLNIKNEILRGGFLASWDIQDLLSSFHTSEDGARVISRKAGTTVPVSAGVRVTGTIETWAVLLYGCILFTFLGVLFFFRIKPLSSIDIETMYRQVVWQGEEAFQSSETPGMAPMIVIGAAEEDSQGILTARYNSS